MFGLTGNCFNAWFRNYLFMYQAYRVYTKRVMAEEADSQVNDNTPDSPGTPHEDDSSASSGRKDVKSALVIMPPEEVWSQIQDIRRIHDDRFERWMPHINMVYPFLKDEGDVFAKASIQLKEALCEVKAFKVCLNKKSFNYFVHKKHCTLWLRPLVEVVEPDKENILDTPSSADYGSAATLQSTESGESANANNGSNQMLEMLETDVVGHGEAIDVGHFGGHDGSVPESHTGKKSKLKSKQQAKAERKAENKRKRNEGSLKSEDALNNPPHPKVLEIHDIFKRIYPHLISERTNEVDLGFQPHLSLGQFKLNEIEEYKEKFQAEWNDIEFEVSNVCLISRKDFHDPFHVREVVPLGT